MTYFVVSEDVPRSAAFHRDVLDQKLKIVLDEQDAHLTSIAGRRFSQRKISRWPCGIYGERQFVSAATTGLHEVEHLFGVGGGT